jgi:tRNA modification GTPase
MRRAEAELARADHVLWVVEAGGEFTPADLPADTCYTVLRNKIDLTDGVPELRAEVWGYSLSLSVRTGAGLDLLRTHLKQVAGYQTGEGLFTARQRHLDALRRAEAALKRAQSLVDSKMPELLAEELRQTQHDLSEITGAFTSDDLLGRIFSSFCIGK